MPSKKKAVKKKAAPKKPVKKAATKRAVASKKAPKKAVKKAVTPKKAAKKTGKKATKKKATKKKATKKASTPKKAATKKASTPKKAAAPKKTAKKITKKATPKKAIKKPALKPAPKLSVVVKPVAPKPVRKQSAARKKQFDKIKNKLQGQKDRILSEAETAMNALPEQTVFPDLGDQASAETDRNFMLRLRGREQRLLNKIEEAVERIDSGDFGICDACGEEISFERLWARPVATLCIDCKLEQEEEEKLQGA